MNLFQTFVNIFRALTGKELAPGYGRQADWETSTRFTGNPDPVEQQYTATRYFDLSLTPYIFAGLRYRDISRLWVSASGIKTPTGSYSNPQILLPPTHKNAPDAQTQEILSFVRWNLDERLQRGMKSVIQRMQHASLTYGRSVQEIIWERETDGTHFGKVVIADIKDRDPERFVLNPKDEKPGVYLRRNLYSSDFVRMPDRKFMVMTNNAIFENPYGISEVRPLNDIMTQYDKIMESWERGLEKAGKGAFIGKYGNELLGAANATKRAQFLEEIRKIANDTCTIMYNKNEIDTIKADLESAAFQSYVEMQIAAISLVLTGSATALQEGKYGSYSKEEATTVRQKSDLEQADATNVSDVLSYQLLTWLIDYNFTDVTAYPFAQIIEPDLIIPTTPEGQQAEEAASVINVTGKQPNSDVNGIETALTVGRDDADQVKNNETSDAAPQEFAESSGVNGGVSPDATPPPEHYETIVDAARAYLESMPVMVSEDFDILPESQKAKTFTISRLGGKNELKTLQDLKQAIADTISITNEAEAWDSYLNASREILKRNASSSLASELFVSFRFARQAAYNAGTLDYAKTNKDALHGLQFATMEDPRVRITHKRLQGIVRPVGDPFWARVTPPLDFNCRCYLKPIPKKDAAKYPYTPDKDLPNYRGGNWGGN